MIRTRKPFWRSRPGRLVTVTTLTIVVIGALLPLSPLAKQHGFEHLPAGFFAGLVAMLGGYLTLVEVAKHQFYKRVSDPVRDHDRRVHRSAARFSHPERLQSSPARRASF